MVSFQALLKYLIVHSITCPPLAQCGPLSLQSAPSCSPLPAAWSSPGRASRCQPPGGRRGRWRQRGDQTWRHSKNSVTVHSHNIHTLKDYCWKSSLKSVKIPPVIWIIIDAEFSSQALSIKSPSFHECSVDREARGSHEVTTYKKNVLHQQHY